MGPTTTAFLLIVNIVLIQNVCSQNLTVETNVGTIRGVRATDGEYNMFLGIPFAEVDERDPFGESVPSGIFEGIFEANDDTKFCPQREEFNNTAAGTLDCLRLHIYVPDKASTERLPVMVWIYGGGFGFGYANHVAYGPKYLVRHDVILVSFNYRVSAYGFLCLDTPETPGNQGLRDQYHALKWIKDNIEYFGGKADDITLFGNSAGSMSVDFHLLSTKERLFDKIIMQSGHAIRATMFRDSNRQIPINIARNLGFETEDFQEALDFISQQDPIAVIDATTGQFRPCVEKEFPEVEAFVPDYPMNLKVPKANGIKFLLGYNADERLLRYYNRGPEAFEGLDVFRSMLERTFTFEPDQLDEIEYLVRRFYIGDEVMSADVAWQLGHFDADLEWTVPAERSIKRYLENGAEEVYYYVFSYGGPRNFRQHFLNVSTGTATHADEISFLFSNEVMPEVETAEDQLIIDRMTAMWTNFAKYGNPTPEITELLPVQWIPITNGSAFHYLDIDLNLTAGMRPNHQRSSFWEIFYGTYAEYEIGYPDGSNTSSATSFILSPYIVISIIIMFIS